MAEAALIPVVLKVAGSLVTQQAVTNVVNYLKKMVQGHSIKADDLDKAKEKLREMEATLRDSEDLEEDLGPIFQVRIEQLQDVGHVLQDFVDECFLAVENQNKLQKAITKFLTSREKAIADILKQSCDLDPRPTCSPSSSSTISSKQFRGDGDVLVGFETYGKELYEKLKEQNSCSTIFVFGPGGSGKSSLVDKVYEEQDEVFSVRKWCQVVAELPGEVGDEKCLIVLDDVWRKEDLNCIQPALKRVGSKIVVTSRNFGVASDLKTKYIVDLSRGLSPQNAKKLFCSKAFHDGQENWPSELDDWGKELLHKCEGIPLAISTVATYLRSNQKKTPLDWKIVHNSLGSELRNVHSELSVIRRNLQPSYRELPSHLRDCFLYFSIFPVGDEIDRGRLMRLWVAENFVQPKQGKTPEQVAEDYLKELVKMNLVVVCKAGRRDRVSKCRVLQLVHEINISRRYKFISVLISNDYLSFGKNCKIRRLSAQDGVFKSLKEKSDMTGVRTFLVFGLATSLSDLKIVLAESKFLRVLDLQGVPNLEQFPAQVFDLILLMYLSMRGTKVGKIPGGIKKLVYLETLDLKRTQVTKLPEQVYELHKLRILLVSSLSENQGIKISKGVSCLSSIQKLSLITVEKESIQALSELKDLRKLGVVTKDGSEFPTVLGKMEHLSTLDVRSSEDHLNLNDCIFPEYLERLHLSGTLISGSLPEQISKLNSLQKISLYGSNLNEMPLDHLQDLRNLIELVLRGYYNGERLEFRANKFMTLEALIIGGFTKLNSLVFVNGATPELKKLNISECSELREAGIKSPENFTAEISLNGALLQKAQHI